MKDLVFVEAECSREFGKIVMMCQTEKSYRAVMELLNDGRVIE